MKHVFLVNPTAGKGKQALMIEPKIKEYFSGKAYDWEIYKTRSQGDAQHYCNECAKSGESYRFYACGGDGTLYEVVNGVFGYPNCEVAVIPLGSGNDFVRLFGERERFIDIDAQVTGIPVELDAIKCGEQIAINQCSMGLDAEVCANQARFKKLPGISGEAAYAAASVYCLFKDAGQQFTMQIDDNDPFTDKVLFCFAGNSRWYGGGFMAAPLAWPDDGVLDFSIVRKDRSRLRLLPLIKIYKQGKHLDMPFTHYQKGKRLKVHSDVPVTVNVDGECKQVTDCEFEIVPKAIKFVVPRFSDFHKHVAEMKAKNAN